MSYEFTKLGAVEALTEMPENANALVEIDGEIKRAPAGGVFVVNAMKTTETESPLLPETFINAWNVEFDKTIDEVLAACAEYKHVECRETAEDGTVTIFHINAVNEPNHSIIFYNEHPIARQFIMWATGEITVAVLIADN